MATRVFISFDYDHDAVLKEFLVGQSKNSDSPFEISDASITTATPNWREVAKRRIGSSDVVAVICGKHTHTAVGVAAELEMAQLALKPYFLLAGYKDGGNRKPTTAVADDDMYKWTWENLKALIAGNR